MPSLVVLNYHGVREKSRPDFLNFDGRFIEKKEFEKQVIFLKKNYSLLDVSSLKECFIGKKLPEKAALITFDDCYLNSFENAVPVLKKHGVPAVFFIPTGLIGKGSCLPQDLLAKALDVSGSFVFLGETLKTKKLREKILIYGKIKRQLTGLLERKGGEEAMDFVSNILRENGLGKKGLLDESFLLMSWKEIKKMSDSGMAEFGSHTVSHAPLSKASPARINSELLDSKKAIERKTGAECISFAYPFGFYSHAAKKAAREKFFFSFTTKFGKASLKTDRSAMPRISMNNNYNSLFPLTMDIDLPSIHSKAISLLINSKNLFVNSKNP